MRDDKVFWDDTVSLSDRISSKLERKKPVGGMGMGGNIYLLCAKKVTWRIFGPGKILFRSTREIHMLILLCLEDAPRYSTRLILRKANTLASLCLTS